MFVLFYQLTFDPLIMYLPWPTSTLWSVNGHQRSLPPILFPSDYLTTADFSLFWFQLLPSTRVDSKSTIKNIPSLEELLFKRHLLSGAHSNLMKLGFRKMLSIQGKTSSFYERKEIHPFKKETVPKMPVRWMQIFKRKFQ